MTFLIGTPHAKGAGYYCNDDTPSGGQRVEDDVQSCKHCQAVVLMRQWREHGGFCRQCNAPVCGYCSDRMAQYGCEPFLRKIEAELGLGPSRSRIAVLLGNMPSSAVFSATAGSTPAIPQAIIVGT